MSVETAKEYMAAFEVIIEGEAEARSTLRGLSDELHRAVRLLKFAQGVRAGTVLISLHDQRKRETEIEEDGAVTVAEAEGVER